MKASEICQLVNEANSNEEFFKHLFQNLIHSAKNGVPKVQYNSFDDHKYATMNSDRVKYLESLGYKVEFTKQIRKINDKTEIIKKWFCSNIYKQTYRDQEVSIVTINACCEKLV